MTIFDLISDKNYQHKNVLYKIISHVCGIKKDDMIKHYDDAISQDKLDKIVSMYTRYSQDKEPLEYIVGYVEFLGNKFILDNRSLIPRAETEYMIQAVTDYIQINHGSRYDVRDVGCGCGVLGLSVALHNEASINLLILADSQQDCLDLTWQNVDKYYDTPMSMDIKVLKSDLLDFARDLDSEYKVILVSNLPYIPDDTFEQNADESAKKREPRVAFLGGKDGLDLYRRMFDQLLDLDTDCMMFLEMMTWQVEILEEEYSDKIDFNIVKTFHFNIVIVKGELIKF